MGVLNVRLGFGLVRRIRLMSGSRHRADFAEPLPGTGCGSACATTWVAIDLRDFCRTLCWSRTPWLSCGCAGTIAYEVGFEMAGAIGAAPRTVWHVCRGFG
jgi:hypothetical protein